jgi:hypothetical protein
MDQVRSKDRMKALTATTHLLDEEIEVVARLVCLGIVLTVCVVLVLA